MGYSRNDSFWNGVIGCLQLIAVLYVTTNLSPTAQEFAKRLGVVVKVEPLGDFPLIKCNINNDSKIYHLPLINNIGKQKLKTQENSMLRPLLKR